LTIAVTILATIFGFIGIGIEIYDSFMEGHAKKAEAERANRKPTARPYNASPADVEVNPKDGLTYVKIPAGRFEFGCSVGDKECYSDEKPPLIIPVAKPFWIGQTVVTQAAFQRVTGKNPSRWKGADLPVESVTWNEARNYCAAIGGRLPTEVEWEYAARGGTDGARYGPMEEIAWYHANGSNRTHAVKTKAPNAYGLYDMLGNVREWTAEWYKVDKARMTRGGSWLADPKTLRASYRYGDDPQLRSSRIGFRCIEK
jgi:formylglycine-generating enzyme required for sulfatase activity